MIKSTKTKDEAFTEQLLKTFSLVRMTSELMPPDEFHELWKANAPKVGFPPSIESENKETWVCFYYHYLCLEMMENSIKADLKEKMPKKPFLRIVK